jgi:hypothetical protein
MAVFRRPRTEQFYHDVGEHLVHLGLECVPDLSHTGAWGVTYDCARCALKPRCTTADARKVSRDIEDVRDHVRALADTEAFQRSRRERKKVEMRFAHMKRILKLDRLRLRGLSGARDEVLLTATGRTFDASPSSSAVPHHRWLPLA